MTAANYITYCLAAVLLVGCTAKGPQRPSQRKSQPVQVDSTALALLALNQQLTERADELLARLAQEQDEPYALYERGTWAHREAAGEGETLREGEECTIHMRVLSLDGRLYLDAEQTAHVGKYELPAAIDANLTEWQHGDRWTLLAPWYAAFGIKGAGQVPPYENVRIELTIQ